MKSKLSKFIAWAVGLTAFSLLGVVAVTAATSFSHQKGNTTYEATALLNATTTSATSTAQTDAPPIVTIGGAKKVSVTFQRGDAHSSGGNAGSTDFSVDVAVDSTLTWIPFRMLIANDTNLISQNVTRVATSTLGGTTTKTFQLDLSNGTYYALRCIANKNGGNDGGENTCIVGAQFGTF